MIIEDLKTKKIKPIKDLVAFQFIPIKKSENIIIPDTYYNPDLRVSRFYFGKVLATGSKVREMKKGDYFLFKEYDVSNLPSRLFAEDKIYFIREKFILAKVKNGKKLLFRQTPKDLEEIEKSGSTE